MRKLFCIVALFSLAVVTLPAYGSTYSCTGTVTSVAVSWSYGGAVFVTGPGGLSSAGMCALNGSAGNFTADGCKAIYATLLAAKLAGQTVTIWFNDSLGCSTQSSSSFTAIAVYIQ